jgi:ubiquinone/menaquinone biosynthesis C-methylase UbiE
MMSMTDIGEIREFWDRVAEGWDVQVGLEGDVNRLLNSDPVLWAMAGEVRGLRVLDAGCGTGYLTAQLQAKGAAVVGVDLSERMIEIARTRHPKVDFQVDSVSGLASVADGSIDLIVSNYVLMDTPDLGEALQSFARVLRPGGAAVVVFSHPCFPQGRAGGNDGPKITYTWDYPYFEHSKRIDPPWGHFTSDFIWFHRPLSDYWKAFRQAGFCVSDFDEPRVQPERYHLAPSEKKLRNNKLRPYSVAFRLELL